MNISYYKSIKGDPNIVMVKNYINSPLYAWKWLGKGISGRRNVWRVCTWVDVIRITKEYTLIKDPEEIFVELI
jgi:hypothetical protein